MPLGQIATVAMKKAAKEMRDKLKKKITGKPKGRSSALGIVGSASKAGMQGKQGTGSLSIKRKPFQRTPYPGFPGRPPKGAKKPKPTPRPMPMPTPRPLSKAASGAMSVSTEKLKQAFKKKK